MPIMNLWAEFDNEQLLAESAGRAQKQKPSQGRRLTEQAILSSLRDWLLHDYVASYCRSLAATRIYRHCYWIDGLGANTHLNRETPSGALNGTRGIDINSIELPYLTDDSITLENPSKKGRKKVAAQGEQAIPSMLQPLVSLSQKLAQENRPITLHGIILEARRGQFIAPSADLSARIGTAATDENAGKRPAFSLPTESGIIRASWQEIAPTLLSVIDQSPTIFLLNPFGQMLFTYDDLIPLYSRTAPTELCLLISHKQLETRVIPSLNTPAGAAALTALLRSDRWKALVGASAELAERVSIPSRPAPIYRPSGETQWSEARGAPFNNSPVDGIINLFIDSMQRHFLSVQHIELPIQIRPALIETAPYTLVFATRRQDSLASMNDALCLHRRRLYEQSSRGVLIEEWFVTQQRERQEEQLQQLYSRALQQGRSQRVRRWPDLRQQLLLTDFGQFTLHEYNEVIRKLFLNGEVRCEWRQTPALAGNAEERIPGNDDTLLWK